MFDLFLALVLNYLLVLGSIVLFMAPFYLLYRRHHVSIDDSPVGFNRHLFLIVTLIFSILLYKVYSSFG